MKLRAIGRPLYEWRCVYFEVWTMSDDQPIEIPRKQLSERSPRAASVCEGQPDIEWDAAMQEATLPSSTRALRSGFPVAIG